MSIRFRLMLFSLIVLVALALPLVAIADGSTPVGH